MSWQVFLAEEGYSTTRVRGISKSFGSTEDVGGQDWIMGALLVILAILIAVATIQWLQRRRREHQARRPHELFREALVSLDMSPEDSSLLLRMVHDLKIPQPTALLLNQRLFHQAVEQWVDAVGPLQADRWRRAMARIAEHTFSGAAAAVD